MFTFRTGNNPVVMVHQIKASISMLINLTPHRFEHNIADPFIKRPLLILSEYLKVCFVNKMNLLQVVRETGYPDDE